MYFAASIKPTSTLFHTWTAANKRCGFIHGVCFVRSPNGKSYYAEKVTEQDIAQLNTHVAVNIEVTKARVLEVVPEDNDLKTVENEPETPAVLSGDDAMAALLRAPATLERPKKKAK